jgi:hypothetical protein
METICLQYKGEDITKESIKKRLPGELAQELFDALIKHQEMDRIFP